MLPRLIILQTESRHLVELLEALEIDAGLIIGEMGGFVLLCYNSLDLFGFGGGREWKKVGFYCKFVDMARKQI